jgi:hypothetical protein
MLQKVFVNDLDPERLARSRNRIVGNGNGNSNGNGNAQGDAPLVPPAGGAP